MFIKIVYIDKTALLSIAMILYLNFTNLDHVTINNQKCSTLLFMKNLVAGAIK